MMRKIATYFISLLGVFIILALWDPEGFVFHPQRAAAAVLLMALAALALWVRYDWATGEDRDEP